MMNAADAKVPAAQWLTISLWEAHHVGKVVLPGISIRRTHAGDHRATESRPIAFRRHRSHDLFRLHRNRCQTDPTPPGPRCD